ncbi:MAG: hypothetical protein KBG77_09190 [Dermatophilaceae bacterium]|nr:hypothetical protein [Dermatophilaceae bacterium]
MPRTRADITAGALARRAAKPKGTITGSVACVETLNPTHTSRHTARAMLADTPRETTRRGCRGASLSAFDCRDEHDANAAVMVPTVKAARAPALMTTGANDPDPAPALEANTREALPTAYPRSKTEGATTWVEAV